MTNREALGAQDKYFWRTGCQIIRPFVQVYVG